MFKYLLYITESLLDENSSNLYLQCLFERLKQINPHPLSLVHLSFHK